jgi:hypothetical protein
MILFYILIVCLGPRVLEKWREMVSAHRSLREWNWNVTYLERVIMGMSSDQ